MPTIALTISLTIDEKVPLGFPLTFTQDVDEITQLIPSEKSADGNATSFTALSIGDVDTVQFLFFKAISQALGLRIEGSESSSTAIRLDAGGFLLAGKVTLTDSNITLNNNAGAVGTYNCLAGGT